MIHDFYNFLKEAIAQNKKKTVNIVINHDPKPIPDRQYDYSAHENGEEDLGMIVGYGKTKEDAITDFQNKYTEKNDAAVNFNVIDTAVSTHKEDEKNWGYDTTRESTKEFKPGDNVFFGYYGSLKNGVKGGRHVGKIVDINNVPDEYKDSLVEPSGNRYPKINWDLYVVVKDLTSTHRNVEPYRIMSKDRIDLFDDAEHIYEAAGPSKEQIAYHMRKARQQALKMHNQYNNLNITPRLIRASNGEAAIVYDIINNGKKETVRSLSEYETTHNLKNQTMNEGENDPWPIVVQILNGKKHPVATFNKTKQGLKKAEKFLEDSRNKYPNTQFELVLKDMDKKKITESNGDSLLDVEITQKPRPSDEAISAAWPDRVLYKGFAFFDAYTGDAWKEAAQALQIGKRIYDDYDEMYYTIDGQECYFGYVPSKDIFIMGFDMWFTDPGYGYCTFNCDGEKFNILSARRVDAGSTFYHSGLKDVHKKYPDIIDLRLD